MIVLEPNIKIELDIGELLLQERWAHIILFDVNPTAQLERTNHPIVASKGEGEPIYAFKPLSFLTVGVSK